MITTHAVLKWFHIIAMVYWLGGEWGVFQTSYNVINRKLPMDERKRHMETAYRIDILARTDHCDVHAYRVKGENWWGVQFHTEMDHEEASGCIERNSPKIEDFDHAAAFAAAVASTAWS